MRRLFAVSFLAFLAAISLAAADEATCKAEFKRQVGECANAAASDPARDPSDFTFWKACRQQHQPEYDRCMGEANTTGASVDQPPTPQCQEAKIAIDWVFSDSGATRTFVQNRNAGRSPYDSVIGAQGHNPHAQDMLRECAGWGSNYLIATYADAIAGFDNNEESIYPRSCQAETVGTCIACEVSCTSGYEAYCQSGQSDGNSCYRWPVCECRQRF